MKDCDTTVGAAHNQTSIVGGEIPYGRNVMCGQFIKKLLITIRSSFLENASYLINIYSNNYFSRKKSVNGI